MPRVLLITLLFACCTAAWDLPAFAAAPIGDASSAASADARVAIHVTGAQDVILDQTLLAGLPRRSVTASAHGRSATYEGVDLRALLNRAGAAPVESLKGRPLRQVVAVTARDGYRVVFSLAELDPTLGAREILLVDRADGMALDASDGPWRLVVPQDARPARWIRQIQRIEVSDAAAP